MPDAEHKPTESPQVHRPVYVEIGQGRAHVEQPPTHLPLPRRSESLVNGTAVGGVKLDLFVDSETGVVRANFTPAPHHATLGGTAHAGLIATILDEAMAWAAAWRGRRFCTCGELTVRFRQSIRPGDALRLEALVEFSRPNLVDVSGKIFDSAGRLLATASGKYIPMPPEMHRDVLRTFIEEPSTQAALATIGR